MRRLIRIWGMKLFGYCMDRLSRLLFWSCRLEIKGEEALVKQAAQRSLVLIFWHDRLFGMVPILTRLERSIRYSAFVSASRDGLLLQTICRRYSACEVIAVAHDKRHQALRTMMQQLTEQKKVILLTPDGPRGPPHVIKPGLFFAARKTGAPVVAMSWSVSSCWHLRSWDRLIIPKPFSRIVVQFSEPIVLQQESSESRECREGSECRGNEESERNDALTYLLASVTESTARDVTMNN